MYVVPFQDSYSNVFSTQAKQKNGFQQLVKLRTGTVRYLISERMPFPREGHSRLSDQPQKKELHCIVTEWENGTAKSSWTEDHSARRPAQEEGGGKAHQV